MNVEEALLILDTALKPKFLNNVQEIVFRQAWLGETYQEIANSSGYNANYIKDVGYKLWKLLSKVFEEVVTKSNFQSVLRRQHFAFQLACLSHSAKQEESSSAVPEDSVSEVNGSVLQSKEIANPIEGVRGSQSRAGGRSRAPVPENACGAGVPEFSPSDRSALATDRRVPKLLITNVRGLGVRETRSLTFNRGFNLPDLKRIISPHSLNAFCLKTGCKLYFPDPRFSISDSSCYNFYSSI